MPMVTNEELIELTGGLKQGAAQKRWIKKALNIDAPLKADGHPFLTWEQVNQRDEPAERKSNINWQTA
ncbi:hypothetical protein WT09_30830 [Burkholderia stagnalis]|uniref:DUF4224 domain-containing protein n=1 Tax=Burkholderia stagnalis TaxID=1503054 RepID=UPI0007526583|nr:DUF4224 domain-containing protein [Burkholderia stagnalis]KVN08219.1 hypothetical protein WT09_30830 [Burkholderia stagnalis]